MNPNFHFIDILSRGHFWFAFGINGYPILMIIWNWLLLVPIYFLARFLDWQYKNAKLEKISQKILVTATIGLWLLLIPNAAYLMSEVRHLINYCPLGYNHICIANAWMILFFFSYALLGWIAFVFLLEQMRKIILKIIGVRAAKIYIWLIIPWTALGVLLGLVNRWNSWDIFIHPLIIARTAGTYFLNGIYFLNLILFIIFFYFFYFLGVSIFKKDLWKKILK